MMSERHLQGEQFLQRKVVREFLRFCVVGTLSTAVDASIFYLVLTVAPYPVALVSGYGVSLVFNYLLTVYLTFREKASLQNAVGVIGAHLINLFVVRMGLMYLFVNVMGWDEHIAFLPTLVISVLANFLMVKFVISRKVC